MTRFFFVLIMAISSSRLCAQVINSSWTTAASGDWTDATKWTPGSIPNNGNGTSYVVTVNQTGSAYSILLNSNISLDSLLINSADATVSQTAGTMSAPLIDVRTGRYLLRGGTISNSEIRSLVLGTSGRFIVMGTDVDSFFDNVKINRTVDIGSSFSTAGVTSSGHLRVTGGLDFLATGGGLWFQGGGGTVVLPGNQTISGVASGNQTSEIVFNQGTNFSGQIRAENGTLTIGPNVRVRVGSGNFNTIGHASEGLLIQGEVLSSVSTKSITITGQNWVNQGLLRQFSGGQINLSGTFTTAGLGTWSSDNDDINGRLAILGTLDNTGATLDFTKDAVTGLGGSMRLGGGGVIVGGTIRAPSSVTPFRTNAGVNGFGTLDGVTLDGQMLMLPGEVKVLNNLNLVNDAVVTVQTDSFSIPASLTFAGNQSITGRGEILFSGFSGTPGRVYAENGGSLTIGNEILVRNRNFGGNLGAAGADLINNGVISAEVNSRSMNVAGDLISNNGTLQVLNNGLMTVTASSIENLGLINVASGTLNNSSMILNYGVISGNGTITGGVTNLGTIGPGLSPGTLTIEELTQLNGGVLSFEIGGTARGTEYDALNVTNVAQLNGSIEVSLLAGFMPTAGMSFNLLDWNTASFGNYTWNFSRAALGSGLAWDTSWFASTGELRVASTSVPEPGSVAFLTAVFLGIAGLRSASNRKSRVA